MKQFKLDTAGKIAAALNEFAADNNLEAEITADDVVIETPPKPELGDASFPMFPYAKVLRMAPPKIASDIAGRLGSSGLEAVAAGPYVNVKFDRTDVARKTVERVYAEDTEYGKGSQYFGEKIMIEFSSPNTNKPLHLGHLRNNALGESVARILSANGADVRKVNLVNDRGVHICKSMLAYKELGNGEQPQDRQRKSDHFVGDYYVKYNSMAAEDPTAEERAQKMLAAWEAGDPEVRELWKTMNAWALDGLKTTYERTGIHFDEFHYESQTYMLGKENVMAGLDKGVFYKDTEGTIWIDLEDINLDKKVLLRKDGTSVYMTQDIGTAINRRESWPFDRLIYVVAYEQNYHFKVLFHVLHQLGYDWADKLFHLSYGMVNLPEGKMKSREGTVVDADNLLDELHQLALEEIREKGRDAELEDPEAVAESVALAAVHYFLLQATPAKDMIFNPRESLSFTGNTGPYMQYMGARISSMFRKLDGGLDSPADLDWSLLSEDDEWELVKQISRFPEVVEQAGKEFNPSVIASYLYDISRTFSRFYHDHPVLNCPDEKLRMLRLHLAHCVRHILRLGFDLVNMPFLEVM